MDDDHDGWVDDCHGVDVLDGTSDPLDTSELSHGTHVAGIIGAVGDNGVGVAGVAWRVTLLPCRFLDDQGEGTVAGAIACLDYIAAAKDRGLNVVATNNSWGGSFESRALSDAIDAQRQRGILFVTAAGNDGIDNDVARGEPCSDPAPNVICVGASLPDDTVAPFSSIGKHTVHLIAPGYEILSTLPMRNFGYYSFSGTSMAAPQVTGTIVLLKSLYPAADWREVKNRILASADPAPGADVVTGGRLNAHGALSCSGRAMTRRLRPMASSMQLAVGQPLELAVMNVVCGAGAGEVTVSVVPDGTSVTLRDDGQGPDVAAGDGIYSATWAPTTGGHHALVFPDGDRVALDVDADLEVGFPRQIWWDGGWKGLATRYVTVGDLDGDGDLEILVPSMLDGPLFAFRANGEPLAGWPVPVVYGGPVQAGLGTLTPATAGDDVLASYQGDFPARSYLAALGSSGEPVGPADHVGTPVWEHPRAPLAYDLDRDGRDEIFVHGAALRWDLTPYLFGGAPDTGPESPVGAELFGDGRRQLIYVDGGLRVVDEAGTLLPGFPVQGAGDYPVVGDVDGDGEPEIVLIAPAGVAALELRIYAVNGMLKRRAPLTGTVSSLPALADLDGDGAVEVIVQGSRPGAIDVIRGDGTPFPGWPVDLGESTEAGASAPVVGDVDGDGQPDVVVTTHLAGDRLNGLLQIFDRNGHPHPRSPKAIPIGEGGVPAIADVDHDGRNEIVVMGSAVASRPGFHDGLWVYDLGGPPHGPVLWGQLLGNSHHTGSVPVAHPRPRAYAPLRISTQGYGVVGASAADIDCGESCSRLLVTGTVVDLTATPLDGQVLKGWSGACSGASPVCTIHMDAARDVTATFAAAPQTLTVLRTGDFLGTVASIPAGIQCGDRCAASYDGYTRVILTATPAPGRKFLRWSGDCTGTELSCDVVLDVDRTVTAEFEVAQFDLTVARTGAGVGAVTSTPAGIDCGSACASSYARGTVVSLTATPAAGSTFVGWSGACTGAATSCIFTMDAAREVSAEFALVRHVLTVGRTGRGGGAVSSTPAGIACGAGGSACSASYDHDTTVTLVATPDAGSTFAGWSGACSGATCVLVMDDERAATADFEPIARTLTVGRDGPGTVTSLPAGISCGLACTATFDDGTTVTLTATPDAGALLAGWSGACSGAATTCVVTLDAAETVTATFTVSPTRFSLTVARDGDGSVRSTPEGIDCGTTCSASYVLGTSVTLTASAAAGGRFTGWSGACAGTAATCVVTMDRAREASATFAGPGTPGGGGGGGCATASNGRVDLSWLLLLLAAALVRALGRSRRRLASREVEMRRRRIVVSSATAAALLLAAGCGRAPWASSAQGGDGSNSTPGPVNPPPDSLWRPAPGATPDAGSYLYLASELGDPLGGGTRRTFVPEHAYIAVGLAGPDLTITVDDGVEKWAGQLAAMSTLSSLPPGYYRRVGPSPTSERGGMQWTRSSTGCAAPVGWFVVDAIATDAGGALASLDLRFEYRCGFYQPPLHGKLHWAPTPPPPPSGPAYPIDPPPETLWRAPAGSTPVEGNYLYLESDPGDPVGNGETGIVTDPTVYVSGTGSELRLGVLWGSPQTSSLDVEFLAADALGAVLPGYYAGLTVYSHYDPSVGGLDVELDNRRCPRLTGWLSVDSRIVVGGVTKVVDLRFEQACEGAPGALRGQLHWVEPGPAVPVPGPQVPAPPDLWQPPPGATPTQGNYLYIERDAHSPDVADWTPPGFDPSNASLYTPSDALFAVAAYDYPYSWRAGLTVHVSGFEPWVGWLDAMAGIDRLTPGLYRVAPLSDGGRSGRALMDWSQPSLGCVNDGGWYAIDSISWSGAQLTSIDLRFEQVCLNDPARLRGKLHWDVTDTSGPPPLPIVPPPSDLWDAPPEKLPAYGNYIYLESEPLVSGDPSASRLFWNESWPRVGYDGASLGMIALDGGFFWYRNFFPMSLPAQLAYATPTEGYYPYVGMPGNPTRGTLSGADCATTRGWVVIDHLAFAADSSLAAADLRFEERCQPDGLALHGKVHWAAGEELPPPLPVYVPPAELWDAPPGATPATGSYVYLESSFGDPLGHGRTYLYTGANSDFSRWRWDDWRGVSIDATGDLDFSVLLAATAGVPLLPGFYGPVGDNRLEDVGRMSVGLGGFTCTTAGWFNVDAITRDAQGYVDAIDVRFEDHCDGAVPYLRGKIHYDPNDTTLPPGPVIPAPEGLWRPAAGATPASGNYVYLESEPGDPVGHGQTATLTQANGLLWVSGGETGVGVRFEGDNEHMGSFRAMKGPAALVPGYYPDAREDVLAGPRPSVNWSWAGAGCGPLTGWFVIDRIELQGSTLQAVDLRFEQRCESASGVLHGQVHWAAGDTTAPPPMPIPMPAGLWDAPPGSTPPTGSYAYFESEPGDPVGEGGTVLLTPDRFLFEPSGGNTVDMWGLRPFAGLWTYSLADGTESWGGSCHGPLGAEAFLPGWYPDLNGNPIRGYLGWGTSLRSCAGTWSTGWCAIDGSMYAEGKLVGLDLRFEQRCAGGPALHGKIHYEYGPLPP